jgi:hypothetical protein
LPFYFLFLQAVGNCINREFEAKPMEAMSMKATIKRIIKPDRGTSAAAICPNAHFTLQQTTDGPFP